MQPVNSLLRATRATPMLLGLALLVAACGADGGDPTATPQAQAAATATPAPTAIPTTAPATATPAMAPTATSTPAPTATLISTATPTVSTATPTMVPTTPTTSSPAPPGTPTPEATEVQVIMEDISYQPQQITVSPGTTVVWVNRDSVPHTVTAGTRDNPTDQFDSGFMEQGNQFSFTFDEVGTHEYYCTIHPGMAGTVVVER